MVGRWRQYTAEALALGYKQVRVTGETRWLAAGIPGTERFIEYEIMINDCLKGYPITVLCQFNTDKLPGTVIFDLLTIHPLAIANGQIIFNPFYSLPRRKLGFPFGYFRRKRKRLAPSERVSTVLLTVTGILEILPTVRRKVEFTEGLLEYAFGLKEYYFCLEGYTAQSRAWPYPLRDRRGMAYFPIRTANFEFGYLILPLTMLGPRLRGFIANYLNVLALSLEYEKQKKRWQISTQVIAAAQELTELRKLQNLESIGILACGIGHDFNNLLAAILSNVQLAVLKWKKGLDGIKDLQAVEAAVLKAAKLTKQLMSFTKGGAPVTQTARLEEVIKETADFALRGLSVKCRYLLPKNLWSVQIDNDQISQVIHNLLLNGAQAMTDGGVIQIVAHNVVLTSQNNLGLRPGNYVRVEIQDQGKGIPEAILTKVFDPYFTTKKNGTGLGLSTSYYIIQNHNGYLGAQSREGDGSTFFFYVPATGEAPVAENKGRAFIARGTGKLLLMDDELLIVTSLRELLERCGYQVVIAKDGREAVICYEEAKKDGTPFDLVILDLTIPGGVGGKEAAQMIFALDPAAKVIASSGYSDDPVMVDYRKFGFSGVVSKPFKMEVLSALIKELLESKPVPVFD
jgi:signal transduction histidine kinase/CheY-like chemotaxis protein